MLKIKTFIMGVLQWILVLLVALWAGNVSSGLISTAIPVRAAVSYLNPKYLDGGNIYVKRFGRNSDYFLNIMGKTKFVFGNNVTVHLVFYEFLHNEYKRSFIEMHFKLCDMINKDPYVGKTLAQTGIVCPVPMGDVQLKNMTIPAKNFPNVWPFENNKVDITMKQSPSQDIIARFYFIMIVKQKKVE